MPELTEDKWKNIAEGFNNRANFPYCLGAIDGKHIRLKKPRNTGSSYNNYKKYFSMILLATCDSNYMFTFVDIGSYGRCSDSTIFEESILYEKLQQKTLNIPEPENSVPYIFVGDEAFSISKSVMRPYAGKQLSVAKRFFNYRLSRARRFIECSFGILANKWRIFHRPIDHKPKYAKEIIKACCVLHNFVRERDGYNFDDTLTQPLQNIIIDSYESNRSSPEGIRSFFTDYFINAGRLEWQMNMI